MSTQTDYDSWWWLFGTSPPDRPTLKITCEECGNVHRLERPRDPHASEVVWVVCHECELPLRSEFNSVLRRETAP